MKNNFVELSGTVESELYESGSKYGETIYEFILGSRRLSGTVDRIVCRLSDRAASGDVLERLLSEGVGMHLKLTGRYASYNQRQEGTDVAAHLFCPQINLIDCHRINRYNDISI